MACILSIVNGRTTSVLVNWRNKKGVHTIERKINSYEYKNFFVIFPYQNNNKKRKILNFIGKKCKENFCYDSKSNKNYLSINELKKLINSLEEL